MLTASLAPNVALAHHAMDGRTPSTFLEGFASGLAHPVIGPDHLAMTLLVGVYCGIARRGIVPAIAFVGATLLGCGLHVARVDLPLAEAILAVSLLVAGLVAWFVAKRPHGAATAAFGVIGVLHGYAYGESIVGAEASPLGAYLLGFALVQFGLAGLALLLTRAATSSRQVLALRVVGAVNAAIGLIAIASGV